MAMAGLTYSFSALTTVQPGRYTLLGNIWIGTQVLYYNSDEGPSVGEWGHFAVGWDGQSIITYYDGVPVGKLAIYRPTRFHRHL